MVGEFMMGPVKRVTKRHGHMVNQCQPIGPYVLRVDIIGTKDGLEYITGVLESGRIHTVFLTGTSLEGWVADALHKYGKSIFLGSWVEIGERDGGARDGELYIELLLSSRDFDLVYAERMMRERPDQYRMWKSMHRVPDSVVHEGRLYYGRMSAASI